MGICVSASAVPAFIAFDNVIVDTKRIISIVFNRDTLPTTTKVALDNGTILTLRGEHAHRAFQHWANVLRVVREPAQSAGRG